MLATQTSNSQLLSIYGVIGSDRYCVHALFITNRLGAIEPIPDFKYFGHSILPTRCTLPAGSLHVPVNSNDGSRIATNHTHRNRPPFPLREFQTCLLCLCFRLERPRQRRELTADVLEEQPLLNDFWHRIL